MNRIGILTMFYNSTNYGGILQAYALIRYLNQQGYEAEQICYDRFYEKTIKGRIYSVISNFYQTKNLVMKYRIDITQRKNVSKWALENIPHSFKIYNKNNIKLSLNDYDIYIAGSDQIWTNAFSDIYLLSFVPQNKIKLSYAASMGCNQISEAAKKKFKKNLVTFKAVSLREKENVKLLYKETGIHSSWCIDPTFLLKKEEWDEICNKPKIKSKYIFCYFLGANEKYRCLAQKYAELYKYKIVTFPHLQNRLEKNDINFGDIQVYDASPSDFLTLIKHAAAVFTDSFHACVFSIIFGVPFYVFKRSENDKMVNRINSLIQLVRCDELFCDSSKKVNLDYITNVKIPNSFRTKELEKAIQDSKKFLETNLFK